MRQPVTAGGTPLAGIPRQELHERLKSRLQEGMKSLRDSYAAKADPKRFLHGRCSLVDGVLVDLWRAMSLPDELAFAAVGGYGRGELYPASDVDLLILVPESITPQTERRLEELVSAFWDIGLDIGHSVRSLQECLAESARDIATPTSLLEARLLAGDSAAFAKLRLAMHAQLDLKAFFSAKHLEQDQRYTRHAHTPYSLEPNCKESPGGLRDLHVIGWIGEAALAYAEDRDCGKETAKITNQERESLEKILQAERWIEVTEIEWVPACEDDAGLFFRVWKKEFDDTIQVVVAFRGTWELKDWFYGNMHWITRFLPIEDQYSSARKNMQKVFDYFGESKKTVQFFTTGYSLGGGLAQHMLYSNPTKIIQAIAHSIRV